MSKFTLMMTVALSAFSTPVLAQTAPAQNPDATANENTGEIIVTATRRSDTLSNVPLAISAVTAQSLQNSGANDIRQLNQLAPSLLVSSTGSEANGSARIRGVGTVGDNPGLESSVAVFIDGVYRSRSGIGLNELGEIERVEVLRGPQGTLFGRNASAGLIHIISKAPDFTFGGTGEISYGNYNQWRLSGSLTGPLSETIAARIDGVYVKRDGFYFDPANNTRVNDRNRYFVRGQLLFKPSDQLSLRLIADYTHRREACCGAVYVSRDDNPFIGNLNELATPINSTTGNNIVNVLTQMPVNPQSISAFTNPYSRILSVTPGRSYSGLTTDGGISGELNYDFGGTKLTSITAYRQYKADSSGDVDYSTVDILYRAADGSAYRQFKTFTQELRLQGKAFADKLDWLIGGYFANENLTLTDNLKFGNQYGRFANCRLVSSAFSAFYVPTQQACLSPTGRAVLSSTVGPLGAGGPAMVAALDRLDTLNNLGSTLDTYAQNSRNWALFTHNIFHVTDQLTLTLGARYTNERKRLNATFGNNNTICTANQAALTPYLSSALASLAGSILGLSCQGNATAELNGTSINGERSEDKFTGTAVLSYKPSRDLMLYASYSRGYKAGGFNLDRSALKSPILPFAATTGGAQALVGNLQFDPETVNAFEIGAKYSTRQFSLNIAAFRQDFTNFQLNTFNGSVFLVQNINGCKNDLAGADRDQSASSAGANYNAAASTTGACAGNTTWGVRSQGVELEASLRPARNLNVGLGLTYSSTKYNSNLVGNASGAPLDQALRMLPGQRLSNAPAIVATASLSWTPELGSSGLSGLVYFDTRMTSDYNTGSDLFPQKGQDGFALVNGRIGIRGPEQKWALELWGQNLLNQNYAQVAFNTPFQAGTTAAPFVDSQYPGGRQLFSMFLAEPRTYGVTARIKF